MWYSSASVSRTSSRSSYDEELRYDVQGRPPRHARQWLSALHRVAGGVTGAASFPRYSRQGKRLHRAARILSGRLPFHRLRIDGHACSSGRHVDDSSFSSPPRPAVSRDLYQRILKRDRPTRRALKMSRVVAVVRWDHCIGIGILKPGSIFTIILFAFGGLGIWLRRSSAACTGSARRPPASLPP